MNCPVCKKKLSWRTSKRLEHIFANHMEELHVRLNAAMKAFSEPWVKEVL